MNEQKEIEPYAIKVQDLVKSFKVYQEMQSFFFPFLKGALYDQEDKYYKPNNIIYDI